MNVIFHTATAIGLIAVTIPESDKLKNKNPLGLVLFLFIGGIILHGALDYTPHRYPLNSKVDVILSLALWIALLCTIRKEFILLVLASLVGNVLPDIIDHLPRILNINFDLGLPEYGKIFPWHQKEYSGSIYQGHKAVSMINHGLLLLMVALICLQKRKALQRMFGMKKR